MTSSSLLVILGLGALCASLALLLAHLRAPLAADIQALGDLSTNLAADGDEVEQFLQLAPVKIDLITRTAINGSWFNFYMCSAGGTVTLPGTPLSGGEPIGQEFRYDSGAEGCG